MNFSISKSKLIPLTNFFQKYAFLFVIIGLVCISVLAFVHYYQNGLGLAYNDARSHLNIGRRVIEGLKPGLAQLGSVWLPLPHLLMVFTIWNDFMWHSGLAGALVSMISFVLTGVLIFKYLQKLGVGLFGRIIGVCVFVFNINILYLQSTAMTELLLLATMTFAAYELLNWHLNENILALIKSAFWIMLSTLVRYDGWFLLAWASGLLVLHVFTTVGKEEYKKFRSGKPFERFKKFWTFIVNRYQKAEGMFVLFGTLAGFGIFLWLLWNLLIFKDPLFFAFGPFSAKAQQDQLELAGVLQTKHQWFLSLKFYWYALIYNSYAVVVILGIFGALKLWLAKKVSLQIKIASTVLLAPFAFNVLALYLGHSVMFIQGLSGETWFNIRYGIMLMPSLGVFVGYLVDKSKSLRWVYLGALILTIGFAFMSGDAATIDDARVGSSQKNVSEVSGWLNKRASSEKGFILISAASHDAIIFTSGLPMSRFIHEGTGLYWESATSTPDRWARWIIMRTHDNNDWTWKEVSKSKGFERFTLVESFPFADIYEIKPEYVGQLNTEPIIKNQR